MSPATGSRLVVARHVGPARSTATVRTGVLLHDDSPTTRTKSPSSVMARDKPTPYRSMGGRHHGEEQIAHDGAAGGRGSREPVRPRGRPATTRTPPRPARAGATQGPRRDRHHHDRRREPRPG